MAEKHTKKISWDMPEHQVAEKSFVWRVVMGILILGLLAYAVREESWTFAAALLLFAGVYQLLYSEKPKLISVTLSRDGLKIGSHKISFSQMKSFWIAEADGFSRILYFRTHRKLSPDLQLILAQEDESQVREFLKQYLPEAEDKEAPFSDLFIRLLKL